jgi:hypothetical protein
MGGQLGVFLPPRRRLFVILETTSARVETWSSHFIWLWICSLNCFEGKKTDEIWHSIQLILELRLHPWPPRLEGEVSEVNCSICCEIEERCMDVATEAFIFWKYSPAVPAHLEGSFFQVWFSLFFGDCKTSMMKTSTYKEQEIDIRFINRSYNTISASNHTSSKAVLSLVEWWKLFNIALAHHEIARTARYLAWLLKRPTKTLENWQAGILIAPKDKDCGVHKGANSYSDFMGLSFFTLFEIYLHSAFERCKVLNSNSVSTEFRGWEIPAHGWIFNEIQPIARFHCAASNFANCTSIGHFRDILCGIGQPIAQNSLQINCFGKVALLPSSQSAWNSSRSLHAMGSLRPLSSNTINC